MDPLTLSLNVLTILALASVAWYFLLRGRAIRRLNAVAETLESYFEPEDREYSPMSFLTGFRAKYKVGKDPIETVGALYTLNPLHILLYWLATLIRRGEDSILISVNPTFKIRSEVHFIRNDFKYGLARLRRELDLSKLKSRTVQFDGNSFLVYYTSSELAKRLSSLIKNADLEHLKQTSVSSRYNSIYIYTALPKVDDLRKWLDFLRNLVEVVRGRRS